MLGNKSTFVMTVFCLTVLAAGLSWFAIRAVKGPLSRDMLRAAAANDMETALSLLRRGARANAVDQMGYNVIFYGVMNKNYRIVISALRRGANPNCAPPGSLTALGQAMIKHDLVMCQILLEFGANPRGNFGQPNDCIRIAKDLASPEYRILLNEYGADIGDATGR